MNPATSTEDRIAALGRASRLSAVLSFLGFVLVLGALGYAARELAKLDKQRTDLVKQIGEAKAEIVAVRNQLAQARRAVAASRAAINAFHAGRLEDAVALYNEALDADPSNAYLLNLQAYALFRLHRVDAAIATQRRSLAADPNYAWGYFDLARFLCAASPPNLDGARQAADQALVLRPDLQTIMQQDGEFQRVCHGQVPKPINPVSRKRR